MSTLAGPGRRLPPLATIGIVAAFTLLVLLVMADISGLTIKEAVSDPQELTRHRFLGVVSNAGALLWASTASICLFAAATLDTDGDHRLRRFFLASAAMAFILLIDDLLLVHEFADDVVAVFVDFDRTKSQKDVLEATVFAFYAMLFIAYANHFRDVLRPAPQLRYLAVALVLFALSTVADFAPERVEDRIIPDAPPWGDADILIEEGLKFVGIAYYAGFYFSLARRAVRHGAR